MNDTDRIAPLAALGQLLSPPRCLACEQASARPFCPPCEASLLASPTTSLGGVGSVVAGGAFGGALADAVRRSKYQGRSDVGRGLARWWVSEVKVQPPPGTTLLVPVPLHPRRLVERGFNQATLLARALGRRHGVMVAPRAARRVRWTTPQASLGGAARRANLHGAFTAARSVAGASICLVDDVFTTGTTLQATAEACVSAGAKVVGAVVVAASLAPPSAATSSSCRRRWSSGSSL